MILATRSMTFRDHRIKGHIMVKLSHAYFIILGSNVRELLIRLLLKLILATHLMTFQIIGSKATDNREVITRVLYHVRDPRTSSYFGKYRGI
jgi:hypothetical protein